MVTEGSKNCRRSAAKLLMKAHNASGIIRMQELTKDAVEKMNDIFNKCEELNKANKKQEVSFTHLTSLHILTQNTGLNVCASLIYFLIFFSRDGNPFYFQIFRRMSTFV